MFHIRIGYPVCMRPYFLGSVFPLLVGCSGVFYAWHSALPRESAILDHMGIRHVEGGRGRQWSSGVHGIRPSRILGASHWLHQRHHNSRMGYADESRYDARLTVEWLCGS